MIKFFKQPHIIKITTIIITIVLCFNFLPSKYMHIQKSIILKTAVPKKKTQKIIF